MAVMRVTKKILEEEVKQLREQLRQVVLHPNTTESAAIRGRIKFEADIENLFWYGEYTEIVTGFDGLALQIHKR